MLDLTPYGLPGEPTATEAVSEGADVVCFSTDKVLEWIGRWLFPYREINR